jgi:hypothetical protein
MQMTVSSTLFVTKLPRTFTAENVRELFSQVGNVITVIRPEDKETGLLRTFGFVLMESEALATAVIEKFDGYVIDGQPIVVKYSDKPVTFPKPRSEFKPRPQSTPQPQQPDFTWEGRGATLQRVLSKPMGRASSMRLTLVGRPEYVEVLPKLVVVGIQHALKQTGFPKGLPTPPTNPTIYTVYINSKQWRRVSEAIQNPEDILIIEGQATYDASIPGIAVFATNVNTKLLQQAVTPNEGTNGEKVGEPAEAD